MKKKEVFACCMVVAHNMVEREVGAMGSTLAEQGARVVGSEIVLFARESSSYAPPPRSQLFSNRICVAYPFFAQQNSN